MATFFLKKIEKFSKKWYNIYRKIKKEGNNNGYNKRKNKSFKNDGLINE